MCFSKTVKSAKVRYFFPQGTFCYWTYGNARQLVKNCAMPDKAKWSKCLVKIFWLRTGNIVIFTLYKLIYSI